ncbi:CBS domain-containing membrane protein [Sphingomonas laterariae]|uniref:CBS domain-containing membrane protein n=1 Tax=Edaphosphingomonas laterariae TaxID=861865 RepID=A0A239FLC6_9SPHN|nr:HPP family protein [Sphingomonas laterariae]SNS57408.1 CBS domain-containing membrane protein [Sphingomonas laterariae]
MTLKRFFAPLSAVGRLGWLRSCLGALCGIILTGLITRLWLGDDSILPILVAPMGASAVLLFAVPASPLAQPWPVLGGNTISAFAGIAAAMLVKDPIYAAGLGVAAAIGAMSLARCLHPPGGAVALTAVIGGPVVHAAGWSFAFVPVALNTALLLAIGWLFNNATRHSYPHRVAQVSRNTHGTKDPPPQERVGYTSADIDTVLARYDELLDVSRDDLDALFRQVEAQAHRRLHGEIRCERIMSRDVISARPDEGVGQARDRLLARGLGAMPVIDSVGHVLGLVGHAELLAGMGKTVGEAMAPAPCLVSPETPIDELLPALSGGLYHEAVVVDGENRLLGLITQTDLLAALWRGHVAERVATAASTA